MGERYEQLIEENTQLKRALISSKAVIDRISNDYETLKSIHEDIKIHYEKVKRDNQEYSNRNQQLQSDKRELEQQFDTTIRNLKLGIEQKQREIEDIQQRVIPSFDQDMLRIRIINDLEIPHRQQLEQKQSEIEKLQEQVYHLKRQIDLSEAKVETIHMESEKELRVYKEQLKFEIDEYQTQINELTHVIDDNKERDQVRRLKKDLDDVKQRYLAFASENEDLRIERDKAREERNDLLVKFSRQIDQERSEKRQFKSEAEKLGVRLRFIEEELRKEKMRRDQLLSDMEVQKSDKDILYGEMRKKDDLVHYLQRKITEMEEENLNQDQKSHENSLKLYNEEHDKYLQERNKAVTILKDLDSIKKRFSDLQDDYKVMKDKYSKDVSELKDDTRTTADEKEKQKRIITTLTKENQDLDRVNKMREEQLRDLDEECETLKKRNRELAHRLSLTETYGSSQKPNKQPRQQQQPEDTSDFQTVERTTKVRFTDQENQGDTNRVQQLQNTIKSQQQEINKLQTQNGKLKDKLKQANQKIMDLLTKKLQDKQTIQNQGSGTQQFQTPAMSQVPSSSPNYRGTYQQSQSSNQVPPGSSGYQGAFQQATSTNVNPPSSNYQGAFQQQTSTNVNPPSSSNYQGATNLNPSNFQYQPQMSQVPQSSYQALDLDDEQMLRQVKLLTAQADQERQRQIYQ